MLRPNQPLEIVLLYLFVSALGGHGLKPLSPPKGKIAITASGSLARGRKVQHHVYGTPIGGERGDVTNDAFAQMRGRESGDASRRNVLLLSNTLWLAVLGCDDAQAFVDQQPPDETMPTSGQVPRPPYAPSVSNLVPATRVRLWIRQLVDLASQASATTDARARSDILVQLQQLLVESPPQFLSVASPDEERVFEQYRTTPTLDAWTRARQKEADATYRFQTSLASSAPSSNPIWALNEGVEQWGERRQFRRLQKEQRQLEKTNAIRAAFNAYTNNLLYGDSVRLTAAPEVRKALIREDRLPDVSSVIRSDLDLRDLYRNQVLSAIDDAKAELAYQLALDDIASIDATELLALLRTAQASCDLWFSLVPEQDAQEALRMASQSS